MWPLKSQNKEHTQAITEVMGKDNIESFYISWYHFDKINPWHGHIKWIKEQAEYKKEFFSPTFEETVRQMAEFSEKNLLIEIK